jgi:hypothetical protein
MANEATITNGIFIDKGNLHFHPASVTFRGTVTGTKGPVPGALSIATAGTDISFAQLTTPGYCKITNLDATNYVEYGIWNGTTFYPLGEILAGQSYVIRLSRNVGSTLRFRANTAACNVVVEAFET